MNPCNPMRPPRAASQRRRVLRGRPHRPPPPHRRAAVHREVHGADPRRRRIPARAGLRTDCVPPRPGQQGRPPPRRSGREDRRDLEGRSSAALARDHGVSRGAISTAVADLLPEHTGIEEGSPVPDLPVTLDMPGEVADFLRAAALHDAERAALDQGVTGRRGQGCTLRVTAVPPCTASSRSWPPSSGWHRSGPAQGPPRVQEPGQHAHDRTMILPSANRCTDVPRGRVRWPAVDLATAHDRL